jgi:hypothetical protein
VLPKNEKTYMIFIPLSYFYNFLKIAALNDGGSGRNDAALVTRPWDSLSSDARPSESNPARLLSLNLCLSFFLLIFSMSLGSLF